MQSRQERKKQEANSRLKRIGKISLIILAFLMVVSVLSLALITDNMLALMTILVFIFLLCLLFDVGKIRSWLPGFHLRGKWRRGGAFFCYVLIAFLTLGAVASQEISPPSSMLTEQRHEQQNPDSGTEAKEGKTQPADSEEKLAGLTPKSFLTDVENNDFRITAIVTEVSSGDTIVINNPPKTVRLLGISAPKRGEPFYDEAVKYINDAVKDKTVIIEVCKVRPLDEYGRILGVLYVGRENLNIMLLEQGLAKLSSSQPCHFNIETWTQYQNMAKEKSIGIWKNIQ